MWPFAERRRDKRFAVEWTGRLRLSDLGREESMEVRIVDISPGGARLALERMRIGSYHLVIGDRPGTLSLAISLPDGTIEPGVAIRWYDWNESLKAFAVGIEFERMDKESGALLTRAVKDLKPA